MYLSENSKDVDAIIFAGDLAYNLHNLSGEKKDKEDQGETGDNWLSSIMGITKSTPFMVNNY